MGDDEVVRSLGQHKAEKFFELLGQHPFLAVILSEGGDLRIYTKNMTEDRMAKIREVLSDMEEDDGDIT